MSVNVVAISGNLTREPEYRQTVSGTGILNLGVAVNDRKKNPQTGEWEDYPNFIDCSILGRRADSLKPYLHKGMKVAIEGHLHYSSWQDKAGNNRSKLEVTVDEIEFMSARNSSENQNDFGADSRTVSRPVSQQSMYADEDIPF